MIDFCIDVSGFSREDRIQMLEKLGDANSDLRTVHIDPFLDCQWWVFRRARNRILRYSNAEFPKGCVTLESARPIEGTG